jgi:phage-related protein
MEKESENDSWWDRAVSAVKSVVKAITSAIDAVFDAVRKVVSAIIDTFVNLATAIIEAGRKWIIEKLDAFGSWLKSKVDKYLSAFPALQKALNDAIDSTVNAAKAAVNAAADRLISGIKAIGEALKNAINSLLDKFQVAMKAAVAIAGALLTGDFTEALKIAFLAAAEIAGIDPKPILDFINRAGESIIKIFKDPIQFFKNLASGVGKGLDQFVTNIKKHLLNGLIGWLTGSLSEAGITLPETFDLKGVFTLVAQILGLTYENIRAKIVKKLGPKAETIISAIEKSVIFVKDLITKGPIALWEKIKESLSDLKTTVMNGIRDFIITTVIKEGIIWIISLLNPASAIVKAIKMLFDVVMFLVERFDQIKNFVLTVYGTVKDIVAGNVAGVAKGVEGALAKSIPVVISFMASLLGLGGIGKTIKDIIAKVKKPIDKAIDKVIDWVVKKGKALLGKAKSVGKKVKEKVVSVFSWWKAKKTFKAADGKSHKLYFTGSGKSAKLTMASKPITYTSYIGDIKIADTDPKKAAKKAALTKAKALAKQIDGLKTKTATKTGVKDETPAFNKLLEDLSVHTALLATDPNGEMPPSTKPIYGGLKNGFGNSMEIKTLTKIKPPGSTPAVSSPLWERLNVRRSGKGSYYILGHLLNNNLGGPGTTWANLTPLSRSGNSQHEVQVESKVKTAVDAGSIIRYKVVPNYPGKANPLKTSIIATADPQRKAKGDIIDAESKIPNELGCSVFEFDPATKKEKALFSKDVPNKIENTKPEHYEVAGIPPPQLVNLSLKSPKTKEDYENLPGVAGSIADTMFSLKDQYKVWKDVWEKTAGVTEDMVSDWRKGGKFTVTLSGSTRSQ